MINQTKKGWECLDKSLKMSKDYNMRHLNTQNYVTRGQALRDEGEYSKAEGNFFRALTACTKQGNRWGLCTVLLNIAELHRILGNHEEGKSLLDEARRYSEEMEIGDLRARCLLEEARFKREDGGDGIKDALQMLEKALVLGDKCENAELSGEINYEVGETLVRMRMLPRATQYYNTAQAKFHEVYDNLPKEFRASYDKRQRERFRDWEHGTLVPEDAPSEGRLTATPARTGDASQKVSAEESLRLVNELMICLRAETSLAGFLEQFLDAALAAVNAEAALWLLVEGQNLSLEGARTVEGELSCDAEDILCLEVIERALASGSIYLADTADDPETAVLLESTNIKYSSLVVLVAPVSPSQQGVLYVTEPRLPKQGGEGNLLYLQPFLSLVPLAYHRLGQNA